MIEGKVQAQLAKMSKQGINVDRDVLSELVTAKSIEKSQLQFEIEQGTGGAVRNANSSKDMTHYLVDVLGERLTKKGKSGKPSLDSAVLNSFVSKYPIIAKCIQFRSLIRENSMLNRVDDDTRNDSILKPHFKMGSSGRIFAENPNVVGLPAVVRKALVPANGKVFISADYKAQELIIAAHIAEEHELVEALLGSLDIFTPIAEEIDSTKGAAKAIIYAMFYGQTVEQAASAQNIPVQQAEDIRRAFNARYPGIMRKINEIRKEAEANRGAKTLISGRPTSFHYERPTSWQLDEDLRRAVNHVIQGTGADIVHHVLAEIEDDVLPDYIETKITVFDACLFEVPEEKAEQAKTLISALMNRVPTDLGFPQLVKCTIGKNWYECTK